MAESNAFTDLWEPVEGSTGVYKLKDPSKATKSVTPDEARWKLDKTDAIDEAALSSQLSSDERGYLRPLMTAQEKADRMITYDTRKTAFDLFIKTGGKSPPKMPVEPHLDHNNLDTRVAHPVGGEVVTIKSLWEEYIALFEKDCDQNPDWAESEDLKPEASEEIGLVFFVCAKSSEVELYSTLKDTHQASVVRNTIQYLASYPELADCAMIRLVSGRGSYCVVHAVKNDLLLNSAIRPLLNESILYSTCEGLFSRRLVESRRQLHHMVSTIVQAHGAEASDFIISSEGTHGAKVSFPFVCGDRVKNKEIAHIAEHMMNNYGLMTTFHYNGKVKIEDIQALSQLHFVSDTVEEVIREFPEKLTAYEAVLSNGADKTQVALTLDFGQNDTPLRLKSFVARKQSSKVDLQVQVKRGGSTKRLEANVLSHRRAFGF